MVMKILLWNNYEILSSIVNGGIRVLLSYEKIPHAEKAQDVKQAASSS